MAEVTDVRVYRVESTGSLRAYATVTLDNAYAVHGLKIMEGENGLWISMPASKNKRGEFKDIFHPVSREARQVLVDAVLGAYQSEESPSPPEEKEGEA
jgi:stage V sporulation protein G